MLICAGGSVQRGANGDILIGTQYENYNNFPQLLEESEKHKAEIEELEEHSYPNSTIAVYCLSPSKYDCNLDVDTPTNPNTNTPEARGSSNEEWSY